MQSDGIEVSSQHSSGCAPQMPHTTLQMRGMRTVPPRRPIPRDQKGSAPRDRWGRARISTAKLPPNPQDKKSGSMGRKRAVPYPDLDAGAGGSAEPVAVGAEAQRVDDVPSIQSVQVLAFVQVPQHGLAVLGGSKEESQQTIKPVASFQLSL